MQINDCFLTASLSRNAGGLFPSMQGLARACARSSQTIVVVGVQDKHTEADSEAWKPVPTHALKVIGPERFSFAPGLQRKLLEIKPDVVQLHGLWRYPSLVADRWHRHSGRPIIVHPHGMLDPWAVKNAYWKKALVGKLYEYSMLQHASCIRALCQSEAESIRQYGLKNPICVIPNGMDLPMDKSSTNGNTTPISAISTIPNSLSALKKKGTKVLLYLGRIHPKKGLANLLRAWEETQRSNAVAQKQEWVLAIAGWDEGGHENELKQLASELHIDSSVIFIGPQFNEAKAACYQECDAFVLPSFSEGLPMVILEAWAHGKPVLMTPQCNLPEGFAKGAALRITTDVESIAQGLRNLYRKSSEDLAELGRNGRLLIEEKFSWNVIASKLSSVCQWLISGGPRPDCVSMG